MEIRQMFSAGALCLLTTQSAPQSDIQGLLVFASKMSVYYTTHCHRFKEIKFTIAAFELRHLIRLD